MLQSIRVVFLESFSTNHEQSCLVEEILELRRLIRDNVGSYRDLIGSNLAAMKCMKRSTEDEKDNFAIIRKKRK